MKKLYISLIVFAVSSTQLLSQNCNLICNGDFETPPIGVTTVGLYTSLSCWNTTSSDGKMELWSNGFNGVISYSNNQHVELNATQAATMYQDFFVATPGINLTIRFAHRARTNPGMTDTMRVSIGPVGGPYVILGNYGDGPAAWGYYSANYIVSSNGNYRILFTPTYYSFGNPGVGNFLDAVSVCLEQPAGIAEIADANVASVYPNPANANVTFKFENFTMDKFTLKLFDQQGRPVKTITEITSNEIKLEGGDLNKGLYIFTLASDKKMFTGKLSLVD